MTLHAEQTAQAFREAFEKLEQARPYAKKLYQGPVYQEAARLMDREGGLKHLYQYAGRFDRARRIRGGAVESSRQTAARFGQRHAHGR